MLLHHHTATHHRLPGHAVATLSGRIGRRSALAGRVSGRWAALMGSNLGLLLDDFDLFHSHFLLRLAHAPGNHNDNDATAADTNDSTGDTTSSTTSSRAALLVEVITHRADIVESANGDAVEEEASEASLRARREGRDGLVVAGSLVDKADTANLARSRSEFKESIRPVQRVIALLDLGDAVVG